jgi:hypothetical protein
MELMTHADFEFISLRAGVTTSVTTKVQDRRYVLHQMLDAKYLSVSIPDGVHGRNSLQSKGLTCVQWRY